MGLPWRLSGKESASQCRRLGFFPWVGKVPWRRKWQPTPVFSPGKSHGQRSLVGYSQDRYIVDSEVAQSCLTLYDPMDSSQPGSYVHGIFQASLGGRNRVRHDLATKTTTTSCLFSGRVGCSLVFSIMNNALLTFYLSASLSS